MARKKQGAPAQIDGLEALIGYSFSDHSRLELALTHASARRVGGNDYQRLEFLGDRVLGLVVAEWIYEDYPDAPEGEMSVRFNALVNAETLAEIAETTGISEWIRVGRELRGVTGSKRVNTRSDVMEALIAAIYLDGGYGEAKRFIRANWNKHMVTPSVSRRDAKTELQEWAHHKYTVTPIYQVLGRTGPDHDPVFVVEVKITGVDGAQGSGRSKREAEQTAARAVLYREGVWQEEGKTSDD